MKVYLLYSVSRATQTHTQPMAQEWPTLNATHQRFLHRQSDTLYITERPNRDALLPPPTEQLLAELRRLIDVFAGTEVTRSEPLLEMTDELSVAAADAKLDLTPMLAPTARIRRIVCCYETQQDDELVEERFKLTLHKATELTVPHTYWGLVAHAIGAFLPHCTRLETLFVHTCDHARLRQTIHRVPSLRLTVIRNDCSNGFWNTASLALFAQLRSEDSVERDCNAVVVAHTNAPAAFSPAEWALATYLFMRNEPVDNVHDLDDDGNMPRGGRAILHDFSDDSVVSLFAAAFAIVYTTAASNEPIWERQHASRIRVVRHFDRRIEYSTVSHEHIVLASRGRNAFIPYFAQFPRCPDSSVRIGNGKFFRIAELYSHIVFGYSHLLKGDTGTYNAGHELLFILYREYLNGEVVCFEEGFRGSRTFEAQEHADEISYILAAKLRNCAPPVYPRIRILGGVTAIPATRMLLLGAAVDHLEFELHPVERGFVNHAERTQDLCTLLSNLRKLDHLTVRTFYFGKNPQELHIQAGAMRQVLDAALSAPCGILGLHLLGFDSRITYACFAHLLRRSEPCLLMDLTLEVHPPGPNEDKEDEHVDEIALQNLLRWNSATGVVFRQLVSLTIKTATTNPPTILRMRCLPELIAACTGLQHLVVDLRNFSDADRHLVQEAILQKADTLKTLQFYAQNDSRPDGTSFTASILWSMRNVVFVSIHVDNVPRGINAIADALVVCLRRPAAEQLTVKIQNHDELNKANRHALWVASRTYNMENNCGLRFEAQLVHQFSDTQPALDFLEPPNEIFRDRRQVSRDDWNPYRIPTDNKAYVTASIEEAYAKLAFPLLNVGGAGARETRESTFYRRVADDAQAVVVADNVRPVIRDASRVQIVTSPVALNRNQPRQGQTLPFANAGVQLKARPWAGWEFQYQEPPMPAGVDPRGPPQLLAEHMAAIHIDDRKRESDLRGDLVSMTKGQVHAAEFLLHLEQLRRIVWLHRIAEHIHDSPDDTVNTRNFAPEVEMASSRAMYQTGRDLGIQRTPGCPTFGTFFDQTGFALQGFPTPGDRPHDATSDLMRCRYGPNLVEGVRSFVYTVTGLGGISSTRVMMPQIDQFGLVYGNENVPHSHLPPRYANVPQPLPTVVELDELVYRATDQTGRLRNQLSWIMRGLQTTIRLFAPGANVAAAFAVICVAELAYRAQVANPPANLSRVASAAVADVPELGGGAKRRASFSPVAQPPPQLARLPVPVRFNDPKPNKSRGGPMRFGRKRTAQARRIEPRAAAPRNNDIDGDSTSSSSFDSDSDQF